MSSGEMKVVTKAKDGSIWIDGKIYSSDALKPSEYEWESQVPAFCAGVAASPSLTSVSTTFGHALAVIFLTPSLISTMDT